MVEWPSGLASGVSWAIQKAGVVADLAMGKSLLANTSKVRLICLSCQFAAGVMIFRCQLFPWNGLEASIGSIRGEWGSWTEVQSWDVRTAARSRAVVEDINCQAWVYGLSSIGCLGFSAGGHHAAQHQDACSCLHNVLPINFYFAFVPYLPV